MISKPLYTPKKKQGRAYSFGTTPPFILLTLKTSNPGSSGGTYNIWLKSWGQWTPDSLYGSKILSIPVRLNKSKVLLDNSPVSTSLIGPVHLAEGGNTIPLLTRNVRESHCSNIKIVMRGCGFIFEIMS
jgi:hypothetical protein